MAMKCYVGMTTNLARRKKEHQSNYGEIFRWNEYGPYASKALAQKAENELAARLNCHAHSGGPDVPGAIWHVYSFNYYEE